MIEIIIAITSDVRAMRRASASHKPQAAVRGHGDVVDARRHLSRAVGEHPRVDTDPAHVSLRNLIARVASEL